VLLKRKGWQLGNNQGFRLYREEQLQLRSKLPKRRKMVVCRQLRIKPTQPNQVWSMDFVVDQLANGGRFRTLAIIDVFSKEALAIEVGLRLGGEHVVAALNRLAAQRKTPQYLFVDNGSEFAGGICPCCRPWRPAAGLNERRKPTLEMVCKNPGGSASGSFPLAVLERHPRLLPHLPAAQLP
jgi:hypothetical protein